MRLWHSGRGGLTRVFPVHTALLLARVCLAAVAAVLCAALGAYALYLCPSPILYGAAVVGVLVLPSIGRPLCRRVPVNGVLLALFAALEGMVAAPPLLYFAREDGPLAIAQASAVAILLLAAPGVVAAIRTRGISGRRGWLCLGLLACAAAGVALWLCAPGEARFRAYSAAAGALCAAFLLGDLARVGRRFGPDEYLGATLEIYLDTTTPFWLPARLLRRLTEGRRRVPAAAGADAGGAASG